MTEEEAKTKWCPPTLSSDNCDMCQGSACMAWRWEPMVEISKDDYDGGILINKHPLADVRYVGSDSYRRVEIPTGFCGLAGKP